MPSPVEALPCGSRSMISTCSPMAASAVPRLMAVVVLPTPPFWLAIAITRGGAGLGMRLGSAMTCGDASADGGGESAWSVMALRPASRVASVGESVGILWRYPAALHIADHDNAAGGIGAAGRERGVHGPGLSRARLACLSQFKLCILPLGEQAHRAAFPQERKTLVEQ